MRKKRNNEKNKVILPPELPPEVTEEDIEVSDEDLQFVKENRDYAVSVSRLDTESITKHVKRVADVEEDALEALYEKRLRKKSLQKHEEEDKPQVVDRVDALPVKTLDGKLFYRTSKTSDTPENGGNEEAVEEGQVDNSIWKLTKAERREKQKKIKKVGKKQEDVIKSEEVQPTSQAAIVAEVIEDLTAEKTFESKKQKLAELGIALLADPNSNIKSLKEMLQIAKDNDPAIVKLGLLSLLAVFKDIIPGYRIRLPTEKELEMKVSRDVKKMRYYESTLLTVYKGYLQKLISLEKLKSFRHVVIRCICTLLDAVPHFNFRETLLGIVVENIGCPDDAVRKLCCGAIKSLFITAGKHGGEATVEAVRLIAILVKSHDCQLYPDSIEPFVHLTFDEALGRAQKKDEHIKARSNKQRKMKKREESSQQGNDGKQSMRTKFTEEVAADYRAASLAPDVIKQREMQSDTLSAVFETYFRILRHTMQSLTARPEASIISTTGPSGSHPLLAPCLNGLGKFSHLIDLDFMGDLMKYLKRLASGGDNSSEKPSQCLTVTERLQCCIVAFKVMRKNLDALNVDLQDFFVQLYNIVLEYRPGRDNGDVLAEALKIMLCDDRQHDMQKAAAFIKRLTTFSSCFGSAESLAALVTVKHLLQKNLKCRNLLENDAGGGSVSGTIAKYQPYASDPNLSGALASVLWELNLLWKHYHPAVSTMAASISSMSAPNQVYIATISPQQAFKDLSLKQESFKPQFNVKKVNKRKRASESSKSSSLDDTCNAIDENQVQEKLSTRFGLLRDIKDNERLRAELDRTALSLQVYEEYKRQKKVSKKWRNI